MRPSRIGRMGAFVVIDIDRLDGNFTMGEGLAYLGTFISYSLPLSLVSNIKGIMLVVKLEGQSQLSVTATPCLL